MSGVKLSTGTPNSFSTEWFDGPQIHTPHFIKAYKALFKIITTDITSLVDKKYYTGKLVCTDCKETYNLLEDEAPSDVYQCRCGTDLYFINKF